MPSTNTNMAEVPENSYLGAVSESLRKFYPDKLDLWHMRPGGIADENARLLNTGGKMIVPPTKVGYIIMTSDAVGLERKFEAKGRLKSEPGVVLCSSTRQLFCLSRTTDKIQRLYEHCWENDILLGCILPWKGAAMDRYVPDDGSADMVMDGRLTSCFVIKYGDPSERIAQNLFTQYGKLAFASSANPSGKGNRGKLQYVGEKIIASADKLIFGDGYVESQQPDAAVDTRWEQGVMVSFADDDGELTDVPTIIRHGLDLERIRSALSLVFGDYMDSHGSYH